MPKQELEVALDNVCTDDRPIAGGVSLRWPDHPVKGRFIVRGFVVGGIKSMLYRKVEIRMTKKEAKILYEELGHMLRTRPNTGTTPEVHTGGSDD